MQYVAKGHKATWLCGYDVGPITSYTAISRTGVGLRATGELAVELGEQRHALGKPQLGSH